MARPLQRRCKAESRREPGVARQAGASQRVPGSSAGIIGCMLGLKILGRPALLRDGAAQVLATRKSLALLMLLARSKEPVPRARVVALLWPSLDEQNGRRNLRRELARLREAGVGNAVRVEGDALTLTEDVSCDADAFDASLEAGRPDEALALWRGPPADGFALDDGDAFDDWLARQREQLAAQRGLALQAAACAQEASGDLPGALAHVESLLADDPLQEQHHRSAMRLHAASGRREAALAQYERCRALLSAELGLTPMAQTQALAAQLRDGDAARTELPPPGLSAARTDRPARLPESLPFVGRASEVARMEEVWRSGRPIFIEGDAGIGKSRLATDFAAAHGPYALARCRIGDAEVPYASFSRALRALAGPTPAAALAEAPGWVVTELTRLLPELDASPRPMHSDEERNRFFEACAHGWQALASENFDAIVLDDWHHADAASRALLAYVAKRRSENAGVGAREVLLLRPELDEAAAKALAELAEATGAERLRLRPLDGDAVFDLVRRLSGASNPARFADRLERATAGNPFFLAETLRHLAETELLSIDAAGAWRTPFDEGTEDYRELPVPASVLDTVRARVRRLAAPARRVLEAAALANEPFLPSLLAPACALSELETVLAIEQAVESQLLREHETGGFAFAHDLVQQAIQGTLSDERRRLVHRRLALGGEASGAAAALIATHHEASGERQRAVAHRLAAGDQAESLLALAEASSQWRQALGDDPLPGQALQLHLRLMRGAWLLSDFASVDAQLDTVAALLASAPAHDDEWVDAMIALAGTLADRSRSAEALVLLDRLARPADDRCRSRLLMARARALQYLGRLDEAGDALREALGISDVRVSERVELLDAAMRVEHYAGRLEPALEHVQAALALSREIGDEIGIARGLHHRGILLLQMGDLAGAEAEMLAADARCERHGLIHLRRQVLYNLCCVYSSQSRHRQALAALQKGWDQQPPMQRSSVRIMYRLGTVDAHFALGDLGAAWAMAQTALDEVLTQAEPQPMIAAAMCMLELLGLVGERALAARLLAAIGDDAVRQLANPASEMLIARAQYEIKYGDVAAAARALGAVAADALADERVRVRHAQAAAELSLTRGDAAAALALLPADDTLGMNDEMRIRGLALRVAAEAGTGEVEAGTLQAAHAALDRPSPHHIATLELHAALAAAAREGVRGGPASAIRDHDSYVSKLLRSLDRCPPQQAAFRTIWALGGR